MQTPTVGVIGAGIMGTGLAQDLAQHNHRVVLVDVSDDILDAARQNLRKNVRFYQMLNPGKVRADEVLSRVVFSRSHAPLADAELVIENVTEKWDVKKAVYAEIDKVCPPECVFAANTSAISITRIASATTRPARVIGMHFMNPVPLKRMVEVIRGHHTSDETIAAAQALLARMNKECVIVKDMPGFVTNRVLMLTVNEAAFLVHEGVAPASDIDTLFKECFGHKMGPLETADLIGLDTILYSIEVLHESFGDSKYRPCPLLKRYVDAGLLGRKSGKGFYDYDDVT